jgi:proline iminopeptidase
MLEAPQGRYVTVGDHRLFIDERGGPSAPPVLFVHGGPGEGCWEFMGAQGDRLANSLRVIGVDQRGCLRSAPLAEGEALGWDEIVDDLEAVRDRLGIERWSLIGHSYGGNIALRYATSQPDRISSVVFENPSWDDTECMRWQLGRALPLFESAGQAEATERCRHLITDTPSPSVAAFWERLDLLGQLGSYRSELYDHDPATRQAMQDRYDTTTLPESWFGRAMQHGTALLESPDFFESLLPRLTELACPAVLIRGAHDPVTSDVEVAAFARVPESRVVIAEHSAHFVHSEEPDLFERLVVEHVTGTSR